MIEVILDKIERLNKDNKLFKIIAGVYTVVIFGIFPLFYDDYYYNILPTKYTFFYITSLILIISTLMIFSILYYIKNKEQRKHIKIPKLGKDMVPEISIIVFMTIALISTLTSDYQYESFWGNEGRYSGCFLMLIYGLSILVVSRCLRFKKWYLDVFLITGMAVCLFGITDYFQMNILGFKTRMDESQITMFTSTLGNINTYTAYVGLVMGVSAVLFATAKSGVRCILYYISVIISFFAIIMGLSDNSYISLGIIFAFLPLYVFKSRTGIRRYIVLVASFSIVVFVIDLINKMMADTLPEMSGIFGVVSSYDKLGWIVFAFVAICMVIYSLERFGPYKTADDEMNNTLRYIWASILLVGFVVLVLVLYDANLAGNASRYGSLGEYLVFNDDWGTHRGYNWRLAIENYKEFSWVHKLFGFGPDTYGIVTHNNNFTEMVNLYQETYDSAHNEYLQYFITMGPLGLISYLTFMISSGVRMIKVGGKNPYVVAVFFAVLCYCAQAFVNIALPIATPVMLILLAVGLAGAREETVYKMK